MADSVVAPRILRILSQDDTVVDVSDATGVFPRWCRVDGLTDGYRVIVAHLMAAAVLFDIDGVLVLSWRAIPAAETVRQLTHRESPVRVSDQHHVAHLPADAEALGGDPRRRRT